MSPVSDSIRTAALCVFVATLVVTLALFLPSVTRPQAGFLFWIGLAFTVAIEFTGKVAARYDDAV